MRTHRSLGSSPDGAGSALFLSSSPWDLHCRFRRHHFAAHLAKSGWRVLFVDPIQTITSRIRKEGLRALPLGGGSGRVEEIAGEPGLAVYRPPAMLPLHTKSRIAASLNRRLLKRTIHRRAREHSRTDAYVQVVNHPRDGELLRAHLPFVYDVMDRFSAYPEYRRQQASIDRASKKLADAADLVTATTEALAEVAPPARRVVIPNGVDVAHYRALEGAPAPAALEAIPRPRIVYTGALHQWFDFDLVADLARRHEGWSFVLIGVSRGPLPDLPSNVHYLGTVPWTELPRHLWNCDLGVIPFVENDLTRDVDPLKFYDYVASDLPVVSSPMTSLVRWEEPGVLSIARDAGSFSASIEAGLRDAPGGRARRKEIADIHDWPRLAEKFEQALSDTLGRS